MEFSKHQLSLFTYINVIYFIDQLSYLFFYQFNLLDLRLSPYVNKYTYVKRKIVNYKRYIHLHLGSFVRGLMSDHPSSS